MCPLLGVAQLCELEELNCNYNSMRKLPDGLGSLTKLRRLCISDNLISAVPTAIEGCRSLVRT